MARLTITADELALHRAAGTAAFLRGREHVRRNEVLGVEGDATHGRVSGRVGVGSRAHNASVIVERLADGSIVSVHGSCTCAAGNLCEHAVALLLPAGPADPVAGIDAAGQRALPPASAAPSALAGRSPLKAAPPPRQPAGWERSLTGLLAAAPTPDRSPMQARMALQFELLEQAPAPLSAAARTTPSGPGGPAAGIDRRPLRIALRPVLWGRNGGWVRSGISWGSLNYFGYGRSEAPADHLRLLTELLALHGQGHYSYQQTAVPLESFSSRRVWDLLFEAQEIGLPLVQFGRRADPVTVHPHPAKGELEVLRGADALVVRPRLVLDGKSLAGQHCWLIGQPAHGIGWRPGSAPAVAGAAGTRRPGRESAQPFDLAPLAGPLDPAVAALIDAGELRIPESDEQLFLQDYFPQLRQRVTVVSADGSVQLPQAQPPVLTLTVTGTGQHRVRLAWAWAYAVGSSRRAEPLWPDLPGRGGRDEPTETRIVEAAAAVCADLTDLFEQTRFGPRLAAEAGLQGIATVRLLTEVVPRLAELPDVEVAVALDGPAPDYRETDTAPVISFAGESAGDGSGPGASGSGSGPEQQDWFDLAVTVTVDGEHVPFEQLFVALAQEEPYLILPSGTYFSLDRAEFGQLTRLIAESKALTDAPAGTVRLNRFQAGMWADIERLGEVTGQAATWQDSVRALSAATPVVPDLPVGLKAILRPYQVDGFGWLATLFEHRLGGVLADDMGLGKTLQALALMLHARERGLVDTPFLVVAPTSVVSNWASESARFAPDLSIAMITQTAARRGHSVAQAAAGAHVVITSYTLFRLEFERYREMAWAGLILDEAQNVKNHQATGYRCARLLPAAFKLAISGTPMENNLMELWSLLSITAPGLFANPTRFTEYYRTPIEKGRDAELLAQLRRRIRPLMLRRTKDQVVDDLPDKQEQIIELELNPKQRKIYQTYLQRERQKVLGLLGDLRKNRFEIFRSLTLLRQASLDVALVDAKHHNVPSTKLDALLEQIEDVAEEGHRVLVFSQFTRFLTSARDRLDAAGIEYCYLDGSTTRRAEVVTRFRTGTAPVFLISLKAGGVGLNLVEADYVIVLDPWWNPATEAQAVDRAHRIGQTKKVMVYRLVAKDTIEEKVMALKAAKAALVSSVLDEGDFTSGVLSAEDIRGLLE